MLYHKALLKVLIPGFYTVLYHKALLKVLIPGFYTVLYHKALLKVLIPGFYTVLYHKGSSQGSNPRALHCALPQGSTTRFFSRF